MRSHCWTSRCSFAAYRTRQHPRRLENWQHKRMSAALTADTISGTITYTTSVARSPVVSRRMHELRKAQKTAFIPFLCAGDPDLATTAKALQYLNNISADVIELGVPYSDPLADGPVIHGASTRALEKGTKLDDVLEMVKSLTPNLQSPLVLFTYYNPIRARGLDVFCQQIKDAGVAGLLVPDLPLELTHEIREACNRHGIELVLLVTPTTPEDRMRDIAHYSQGFVYLVSVTGVTGARASVSNRVEGLISSLHRVTDKSVSVGFGVSTGEQAKVLKEMGSDGVIVGSALVRALHEGGLEVMQDIAKSIKGAIE